MQSNINQVVAGREYYSLTLTGNYSFVMTKDGRRLVVEAKCKCGVVKNYPLRYLKTGNTKSCGCERRENIVGAVTKHKLSKNPLYSVYQDIKRRCYTENYKCYKDYGARGIKMCSEWFNDIHSFVKWGNDNGYAKGLEIDRKYVNGDYEPSNCRFVTRAVGNTNTRRTSAITAFGETKTFAEWSRDARCSISEKALATRIRSGKWGIEDAILFTSNQNKKELSRKSSFARMIKAFNEEKSIIEWSEDRRCKVGYSGLKKRLREGWEIEKAISFPKQ